MALEGLEAFAAIRTLPETLAPSVGLRIETVSEVVVMRLETVMTTEELALFPAAS